MNQREKETYLRDYSLLKSQGITSPSSWSTRYPRARSWAESSFPRVVFPAALSPVSQMTCPYCAARSRFMLDQHSRHFYHFDRRNVPSGTLFVSNRKSGAPSQRRCAGSHVREYLGG